MTVYSTEEGHGHRRAGARPFVIVPRKTRNDHPRGASRLCAAQSIWTWPAIYAIGSARLHAALTRLASDRAFYANVAASPSTLARVCSGSGELREALHFLLIFFQRRRRCRKGGSAAC